LAAGSGAASGFEALTGASVSVTGCDAGAAAFGLAEGVEAATEAAAGTSDAVRRVAT
jgi:hypothetical protein